MSDSNISEIDALKIVDDTIGKISEQDSKRRIIDWIISKYFKDSNESFLVSPKRTSRKKTTIQKGNRKPGKGKPTYSIIKDLILNPKSKKSFKEFVADKKPSNHKEKCVICIYYLSKTLELTSININHIYTCYKNADWKVPKDFKNMLHQSGTEGWLDTKDGNNLLVTAIGEDLIEHDLPYKEKKK